MFTSIAGADGDQNYETEDREPDYTSHKCGHDQT